MAVKGEFVTRTLSANLASQAASEWIPCDDLINISYHVVQKVDSGTVTLQVESTPDGTGVLAEGSTVADTDFAAGVDAYEPAVSMSDANGMPRVVAALRLNATAYAASGEYQLVVIGQRRF